MAAAPDGFARVLAAEAVCNFGSMLSRLAIPWIAALLLAATPLQMGWLRVADVLAAALGALLLAGAVDRSRKRALMLAADLLRALLLAALGLLAAFGALSFALLLLVSAAAGLLTMLFELARSAWMAQRLDPMQLAPANARLSIAGSLSETAAFAIGGWLFQAFGAVVALLVDAASYALSALCLRGVPEAPGVAPARPGLRGAWADAAEGWRAIAARPVLRALAGIEVLLALAMSLSATSYMIFVSRDVALPTGWLGMIFAAGGLGAVGGAALAPALARRIGAGRAIVCGLVLFTLGTACVPLVAAPGAGAVALLLVQQIVGDAGHVVHEVHDRTLRQTAVPSALLARADAGLRAAGLLATLVGAIAGGAFATVAGTRAALWLAAALAAAAALLAASTLARRRC